MKKAIKIILIILLILAVGAGIAFAVFKAGKKTEETKEGTVTASIADFSEDADIFTSANKYPDRYTVMLTKGMDMDKKEADSFIKQPEEWLAYTLFIDVRNDTDKVAAFTGAEIEDNGKDGLYISKGVGGSAVTVPENSTGSIALTVLLHSPDPSMDEVRAMVEAKNISIKYAPFEGESPDDIDEESIQLIKVD